MDDPNSLDGLSKDDESNIIQNEKYNQIVPHSGADFESKPDSVTDRECCVPNDTVSQLDVLESNRYNNSPSDPNCAQNEESTMKGSHLLNKYSHNEHHILQNEMSAGKEMEPPFVKSNSQNEQATEMEVDSSHQPYDPQDGSTVEHSLHVPLPITLPDETSPENKADSLSLSSTPQDELLAKKKAESPHPPSTVQNDPTIECKPESPLPSSEILAENEGSRQPSHLPYASHIEPCVGNGVQSQYLPSYIKIEPFTENEGSQQPLSMPNKKLESPAANEAKFISIPHNPQNESPLIRVQSLLPNNLQINPCGAVDVTHQSVLKSSHYEDLPLCLKNVSSHTDPCYVHSPLLDTNIQDVHGSQAVVFNAFTSKGDTKNERRVVKPCGLANLGNTCYMNAALQSLGSVVDLKDYFLNEPEQNTNTIASEISNMIRIMWSENRQITVRPENIKRRVGQCNKRFSQSTQEDSQEFLITLLGMLHDDMKRIPTCTEINIPRNPDLIEDSVLDHNSLEVQAEVYWSAYLSKHGISVISDVFEGQLQSSMRCGGCNQLIYKFDPFMFLSLPVPNGKQQLCTLGDCLESFFKTEHYDDKSWCCSECSQKANMERKRRISRLPNTLMIYLKRFQHDAYGRRSKVNTCVKFPLKDLDISLYMSNDTRNGEYNLTAVIYHTGSINGGHYTAFGSRGSQWYYFNDQCVEQYTSDNIECQGAYVLFYQKKEESNKGPQVKLMQPISGQNEQKEHEIDKMISELDSEGNETNQKRRCPCCSIL